MSIIGWGLLALFIGVIVYIVVEDNKESDERPGTTRPGSKPGVNKEP